MKTTESIINSYLINQNKINIVTESECVYFFENYTLLNENAIYDFLNKIVNLPIEALKKLLTAVYEKIKDKISVIKNKIGVAIDDIDTCENIIKNNVNSYKSSLLNSLKNKDLKGFGKLSNDCAESCVKDITNHLKKTSLSERATYFLIALLCVMFVQVFVSYSLSVFFPGALGLLIINLIIFPTITTILNEIHYGKDIERINSIAYFWRLDLITVLFKRAPARKIFRKIILRMLGEYAVYKTQNYIQNKYKEDEVSWLVGYILGSVNRFLYVFDVIIKNGRIKIKPF